MSAIVVVSANTGLFLDLKGGQLRGIDTEGSEGNDIEGIGGIGLLAVSANW